ncbi:phage head-tail joining protein [Rivihabitans pingtungensis]|uniref:phage head-tail joining protein n=1 Tax=Rivihabitans pingtungensis TaxID=1054498 RepID=UPI0023553561|nr:hypothetical protein [Rivihabitans pingtungensis]MCK6435981.1 hypothetical protein [Rivihabitans pingtungensis]
MAFTLKQLDAVEQALARGERVVRYGDRTVEYRSVDELIRLRDAIRADLAQAVGAVSRSRQLRVFHASKGI